MSVWRWLSRWFRREPLNKSYADVVTETLRKHPELIADSVANHNTLLREALGDR